MPGVQAASLPLSKQTRAYISSQLPVSQPCFQGNHVRWTERGTDALQRANPLSSKVCLTLGHVTPVPMTTRLEGSLDISLIKEKYHTCQQATLKSRRGCRYAMAIYGDVISSCLVIHKSLNRTGTEKSCTVHLQYVLDVKITTNIKEYVNNIEASLQSSCRVICWTKAKNVGTMIPTLLEL